MSSVELLLWIAIISSVIVLLGYEIWNLIVVSRDFARISREAREHDIGHR